ncbi:MAG: LacI family transcriptional regulator [Chloroflexi bacterium]|nr:LacI family transcriptional regulator [Chloroflexota bacterium]MCC6896856.1 LacI family DNA-binding transcriptional regulator [Anaerolineae bacterium]
MTTIRDVAEAAGVSIATVSRVLSKSNYPVSQDTRERIISAAKTLGYSVNRAARSLRTDRSYIIGVIVENFSSYFAPAIIRGLQDVLHHNGYFCLVVDIPWEEKSQSKVVQDLLGHSVDGFIFVETWSSVNENAGMLSGKPYGFVHRLFHEPHPNSVIPDELYNQTLVVNHLINMGYKRIGYISGPPNFFSSADRLNAYCDALTAAGLPVDDSIIMPGNWSVPGGYKAMVDILALPSIPPAVVAANDQMAFGAIRAIQDAGLRVPEDIAVVGYDDDEFAKVANPTITTVNLPLFEMGQVAATNLLKQLHGEAAPTEETRIRSRLIVRQSCGSPEGRHVLASDYMRHDPNADRPAGKPPVDLNEAPE